MKLFTITITGMIDDQVSEDQLGDMTMAAKVQIEDYETTPERPFAPTRVQSTMIVHDVADPVSRWVEPAKERIRSDYRHGAFSDQPTSFAELHNSVDANEYVAAAFAAGANLEEGLAFANELADRLDAWLASGGLAEP